MNTKVPLVLLLGGISVALSGCTFPSSRRVIPAAAANVVQHPELGTVMSVREVNIEGQKSNLGMYGGGLIGSAAASGGGANVGGRVVQATGAVVGAVAGQAVEE